MPTTWMGQSSETPEEPEQINIQTTMIEEEIIVRAESLHITTLYTLKDQKGIPTLTLDM